MYREPGVSGPGESPANEGAPVYAVAKSAHEINHMRNSLGWLENRLAQHTLHHNNIR